MSEPLPSTRQPPLVHRCLGFAEQALREAGVGREPVMLAVSGGSDSAALLEIAWMLAPRLELALHVAHIDHGMRPAAPAEAAQVRAAAEARGASFHLAAIDPGRGDEDTMRKARYAALERLATQAGCRVILLGHTADDQVETVLFRFLRGAGFGGLAGMPVQRPPLLRPLLRLRREELRRLLTSRGVAWSTDSSNLSWRYARGRLRRTVIPAVEAAFGGGVLDHLLDLVPRWRADEDFLEMETTRLLAYARRGSTSAAELDAEALAGAHPALRARALKRWIAERTGHVPASRELAGVERWIAGAGGAGGAGIDLPGGRIQRQAGRLMVLPPSFCGAAMDMGTVRGDAGQSSPVAAVAAESGGEALLPPSEARVRVPRN